ncbi:MAG: sigma-70 family RNA polymerase sigma factor [Clostridia bacterium]|nr:sigma-70 family RNA polymerase sigma factor [Clostridia bacterium]
MDTVSGPNRHEEERLTHLVETYQLTLLRLCFAYLHDRALAEDAVQETFLKAYRALPRFRGNASEKTWLSRIAVNTCRDMRRGAWFRHTDRTVTLDMLPEPSVSLSPRDDTITLAVMALPLKLRECVLLYYFQDMNTGEIADTLGISQQAVSTRLMRARGRLRKTLEQEEYERG